MRLDKKLLLHDSEQNRKDNLEKGLKVLNFLQDLKMDNLLGRVGGKEDPLNCQLRHLIPWTYFLKEG